MKTKELENYLTHTLTLKGEEDLVKKINPTFTKLVQDLILLPEEASRSEILECFRNCITSINGFEDEIETIERESILDIIYALGEIVGLDSDSEYAEEWRGDW